MFHRKPDETYLGSSRFHVNFSMDRNLLLRSSSSYVNQEGEEIKSATPEPESRNKIYADMHFRYFHYENQSGKSFVSVGTGYQTLSNNRSIEKLDLERRRAIKIIGTINS